MISIFKATLKEQLQIHNNSIFILKFCRHYKQYLYVCNK